MTIEEKISELTERIEDLAASGYVDSRTEENLIKTAICQFAREVLEIAAVEVSDYGGLSRLSLFQLIAVRSCVEIIRSMGARP